MSKRSAVRELTHDNWCDEEAPEAMGTFRQAPRDQLALRNIKRARRRGLVPEPSACPAGGPPCPSPFAPPAAADPNGKTNVFGGVNLFALGSAKPGQPSFSFLQQQQKVEGTAVGPALSLGQPPEEAEGKGGAVPPASGVGGAPGRPDASQEGDARGSCPAGARTNGFGPPGGRKPRPGPAGPQGSPRKAPAAEDEAAANTAEGVQRLHDPSSSKRFLAHLKALNESVLSWARGHLERNPHVNLTPVFEDYARHFQSLGAAFPRASDGAGGSGTGVGGSGNGVGPADAPVPAPRPGASPESSGLGVRPAPGFGSGGGAFSPSFGQAGGSRMEKTEPTVPDKQSAPRGAQGSGMDGAPASGEDGGSGTKAGGSGTEAGGSGTEVGGSGNSTSDLAPSPAPAPASGFGRAPDGEPKTSFGFSFGQARAFPFAKPSAEPEKASQGSRASAAGTIFPFSAAGAGAVFPMPSRQQESTATTKTEMPSAVPSGFSFPSAAGAGPGDAPHAPGDEGDPPPRPEVEPVKEKNSVFEKKCKLFYMKENKSFVEKGIGTLYLKLEPGMARVSGGGDGEPGTEGKAKDGCPGAPGAENGEPGTEGKAGAGARKCQLLIRALNALGSVLLNVVLNASVPAVRAGKNGVMIVCVPNPPVDMPREGGHGHVKRAEAAGAAGHGHGHGERAETEAAEAAGHGHVKRTEAAGAADGHGHVERAETEPAAAGHVERPEEPAAAGHGYGHVRKMLIRVKTAGDADQLLAVINKYKQ